MHGSLIPYGRWSSIIVAGVLSWPVPARCEALSGDGSVAEPCALQRSLTTGVFVAEHIPGGFTGLIDPSGFEIRDERVPGGTITRFNVLGLSRNNTPLFDWRAGDPHWSGNELFYPGGTMAVEYHHSTQGLRQNFVVYQLTAGEGALHVAMSITGDRSVRLNGESDLQFLGPDGIVQFDYRDLHCWDALNTPLHAHFELTSATHGHQLDIVVDDRDAHYPITIDPISTSPATLLIGPQTNQEYGFSVATAGGAAIGLGAVFLHLQAELNFHKLFNEEIDNFTLATVSKRQKTAFKVAGVPLPS